MKIKKAFFTLAAFLFGIAPQLAQAQELKNYLAGETTDIRVVIGNIIRALLGLTGIIAFVMFIWGGLQWMLSGGSADRVKKGKDTLIWAVIGLVVIFTSYTLVTTLIRVLTG